MAKETINNVDAITSMSKSFIEWSNNLKLLIPRKGVKYYHLLLLRIFFTEDKIAYAENGAMILGSRKKVSSVSFCWVTFQRYLILTQ